MIAETYHKNQFVYTCSKEQNTPVNHIKKQISKLENQLKYESICNGEVHLVSSIPFCLYMQLQHIEAILTENSSGLQ